MRKSDCSTPWLHPHDMAGAPGRYLKKVEASLAEVKDRVSDGSPITLLAHSAGGWLARVFLLGYGTSDIDRLITVGSPHLPPPEVCPCSFQVVLGIVAWILNCRYPDLWSSPEQPEQGSTNVAPLAILETNLMQCNGYLH